MFIFLKRFVRAICLPAFGHVLFGCFVQAFRLDVQALYPLLVSGCFIGVFCSDVLFESSVLCFVRVFCRGGGACFARWFCSGVGAFVVFCSDAFLGRPLKCFVRVRGLKTSVRALHHTLCSEHEN